MHAPSLVVDTAQQLAAAGQHAEVVKYLGGRGSSELENSASLALLYGTAQARLGRHAEGQRWLDLALEHARRQRDDAVERRALNARGAAAFVSGRIDEAADYFTQALMRASRDGDFVMTGRCSNNLGILSNLRGRYAEAIGSWEIAIAAFERAGGRQGVAECYHNLAITYRLQGMPDRALAQPTVRSAKRRRLGTRRSGRSPCGAGRRSAPCAVSWSWRAATWRRWRKSGAAWPIPWERPRICGSRRPCARPRATCRPPSGRCAR